MEILRPSCFEVGSSLVLPEEVRSEVIEVSVVARGRNSHHFSYFYSDWQKLISLQTMGDQNFNIV